MKFISGLLLLFAFAYSPLFGGDFEGIVVDGNQETVAFATVVLVDLDLIETSNEDGEFTFNDISPGTYTMLVIAPGFLEWEEQVEVKEEKVVIVLSPEVVDMDRIIVTAGEDKIESLLDNEVTEEELERLPTRSDPFEAVSQESGILIDIQGGFGGPPPGGPDGQDGPPTGKVEITIEGGTIGRLNVNRRDGISVYGGESDWNNYYYDYIRIPTNTHAFGYPVPDAIVPVEVVDQIGIFKGVIPVEHGPAIGGLFTMEPSTSPEQLEITFTPSIMDISLHAKWPITEDLNLLVSANQSIVQFTVLPIIASLAAAQSEDDVNEEGDPTSFTYGDTLLRLAYTPPNHLLSVDALAFYDAWLFDISFEEFVLYSEYGPYYVAAGSNWTYSPSSELTNSLYGFYSYYNDFGRYDFQFPTTIDFSDPEAEPDGLYKLHFDWRSKVSSIQGGDELIWNFLPSSSLLVGLNGRVADMYGDYTEVVKTTDLLGTELTDETLILPGIDDLFFSAYGYAKLLGYHEVFNYTAGAGVLWYPEVGVLRPSVHGEFIYLGDSLVVSLGAGWSPGIIDEFTYIDRRLDEQYYELESTTDLYRPPMAVSAATQVVLPFSESQSISFSPYFAWYYDLTGVSVNTTGNGPDGAFLSYDPAEGYSAGFDLNWKAEFSPSWQISASYAFSYTRYLTEDWGWVAPNSEVIHALKSGLLFKRGGFKIGQNLLVYSGIPFTPDVVVKDEFDVVSIGTGDYNSAINFVPIVDVKTNISYRWDFPRFDMSIFLNSSNWLDFANGAFLGIKTDKQEVVGTSSAVFSNREYDYSYDWTNLLINALLSDVGLSFSF